MLELIKKEINTLYQKGRDKFFDIASEKVGVEVRDFHRHSDTGSILADNSYWKNEKEIEEESKKIFAEEFYEYNFINVFNSDIADSKDQIIKEIINYIGN